MLSDDSQAKMGFVRDMREGEVYLKDYDDYLEVYRAEGSGLKVVCVSNFPEGKDLIQRVMSNMAVKKDRSVSPHPVLVAHPTTTMPEPDAVSAPTPYVPKLVCTVSSLGVGLENWKVMKSYKRVTNIDMTELYNYYGNTKKMDLSQSWVTKSLMRRYL